MADCEPRVAKLQQSLDQQRVLGQATVNEELPRILDQFQQTVKQVREVKERKERGVRERNRGKERDS